MTENTQKNLSATVAEIIAAVGQRRLAHVSPLAGIQEIIAAFARAEHTRLVYVVDSLCHSIPSNFNSVCASQFF